MNVSSYDTSYRDSYIIFLLFTSVLHFIFVGVLNTCINWYYILKKSLVLLLGIMQIRHTLYHKAALL